MYDRHIFANVHFLNANYIAALIAPLSACIRDNVITVSIDTDPQHFNCSLHSRAYEKLHQIVKKIIYKRIRKGKGGL